jgi:FimV-like protein
MAKKSKQAAARPAAAEGKGGPESTPLSRAREALEAGDARRARTLAKEAAQSGPEPEREEARKLLARMAPDPVALLTVAVVLLLIAVAAWAALLRAH